MPEPQSHVTLSLDVGRSFREFHRAARREFWTLLLRETRGDVAEVARLARVNRRVVYYRLRSLALRSQDFRQ